MNEAELINCFEKEVIEVLMKYRDKIPESILHSSISASLFLGICEDEPLLEQYKITRDLLLMGVSMANVKIKELTENEE